MKAKGLPFRRAYASRLEERYAQYLALLKHAGDIYDYWYEPLNLRLAEKTYYRPDFLVQRPDGLLEIHEVKGHWEEDARVKWKVAAALYPCFTFVAIQWVRGAWQEERL